MLTMRTRYALAALTQLALRPGSTVPIAELAERGRIPRKFLEAILLDLKRDGMLTSQRGPGGGYTLGLNAAEVTLASIVQALDGALVPALCSSDNPRLACELCRSGAACSTRPVLDDLERATSQVLEGTTLADLAHRTLAAQRAFALRRAI
jgi:Rrf2 family protein